MVLLGCQRLEIADDDGGVLSFGSSSSESSSSAIADSSESEDSNDTTVPGFDCDPVLQTGCNGDEKCTAVVASGAVSYVCTTDPGNLDPFDGCEASIGTGVDGCPVGFACIADELDAGLCVPLCLDTNDCDEAVCINEPLHNIPFCATECSPFEGGCISPTQCRRGDDRFACTFPHADDVGGQGEPCNTASDAGCGEGYVCVAGGLIPDCTTDNCCTTVCDVTEDTCDSPSTCTPIFPSPAPGSESIGACLVPS